MFLEQIHDVPNKMKVSVAGLQTTDLPIVMYGSGSYAYDVADFLDRNDIKLTACAVDKPYVVEGQLFRDQLSVEALEDLYERYESFHVIIGFSNYRQARQNLALFTGKITTHFFDAPDRPYLIDYAYVQENSQAFEETYAMLADDQSRQTMIAFVNAKINGDPDALFDLCSFDQYFPDVIQLANKEVFVDGGAFDGDTLLEFAEKTKKTYRHIYAFEPDAQNFAALKQNVSKQGLERVEMLPMGCWSEKTTLKFVASGKVTATVSEEGESSIEVDTIDNIVGNQPVSFIKMDIEGTELGALQGAAATIRESQPRLAICVYHKQPDLITIPQYIRSLLPNHKLYLRQHQYVSWDMVLYAVPA